MTYTCACWRCRGLDHNDGTLHTTAHGTPGAAWTYSCDKPDCDGSMHSRPMPSAARLNKMRFFNPDPDASHWRLLSLLWEGEISHHYAGKGHRSVMAGGLIETCTDGRCPEFVAARAAIETTNTGVMNPDPLRAPGTDMEPDTSTIPDPAEWADDEDSGLWAGVAIVLVVALAALVIGIVIGRTA